MLETVSVIIPTHNRATMLPRSVLSAANQTVAPYEIIVVDDASSDNTQAALADLASRVSPIRLHVVRLESCVGNGGARNEGIRHANGGYIAFLDDDDFWFPDKLELQLAALRSSGADACFCGTIWQEESEVLRAGIAFNPQVRFEHGGPTSVWLLKREVFDRAGLFDETLPSAVDGEYLVRLHKVCRSEFVDKNLYVHVYHKQQVSASASRKLVGFQMMLDKHQRDFSKQELESLFLKMCVFKILARSWGTWYAWRSVRARVRLKTVAVLFLSLLPLCVSHMVVQTILDRNRYPKSFAGRMSQ